MDGAFNTAQQRGLYRNSTRAHHIEARELEVGSVKFGDGTSMSSATQGGGGTAYSTTNQLTAAHVGDGTSEVSDADWNKLSGLTSNMVARGQYDSLDTRLYAIELGKQNGIGCNSATANKFLTNTGTNDSITWATIQGLLPSQSSGQNGNYLMTNGIDAHWMVPPWSILPTINTGSANQFLTNNGTGLSWESNQGLPSQSTNQNGHVLVTNGTSASWVNRYIDNLLPPQPNNAGKFLGTDGSSSRWLHLSSLLPLQNNHAGEYLTTDGNTATWGTLSSGVFPSQSNLVPAAASNYRWYLTTNGSTVEWTDLNVTHTTIFTAIDAVLPAQGNYAGHYLTTNGTNPQWKSLADLSTDLRVDPHTGFYNKQDSDLRYAQLSLFYDRATSDLRYAQLSGATFTGPVTFNGTVTGILPATTAANRVMKVNAANNGYEAAGSTGVVDFGGLTLTTNASGAVLDVTTGTGKLVCDGNFELPSTKYATFKGDVQFGESLGSAQPASTTFNNVATFSNDVSFTNTTDHRVQFAGGIQIDSGTVTDIGGLRIDTQTSTSTIYMGVMPSPNQSTGISFNCSGTLQSACNFEVAQTFQADFRGPVTFHSTVTGILPPSSAANRVMKVNASNTGYEALGSTGIVDLGGVTLDTTGASTSKMNGGGKSLTFESSCFIEGNLENRGGDTCTFLGPMIFGDANNQHTSTFNAPVVFNGDVSGVLPSQSTHAGKFLTTDGSNLSWGAAGGGGPSLSSDNVWTGQNVFDLGNSLGGNLPSWLNTYEALYFKHGSVGDWTIWNYWATAGGTGVGSNYIEGVTNFRKSVYIFSGQSMSAPVYHTTSDDRLKFDEQNLTDGLATIRQLQPQVYQKSDTLNEQTNLHTEVGLIAQEVAAIPQLQHTVTQRPPQQLPGESEAREQPFTVNYTEVFTYAVQAIKDLDAIVTAQAATIATLQARVAALEQ